MDKADLDKRLERMAKVAEKSGKWEYVDIPSGRIALKPKRGCRRVMEIAFDTDEETDNALYTQVYDAVEYATGRHSVKRYLWPMIPDARELSVKYGLDQVVVISIKQSGQAHYASYGKDRQHCKEAQALGDAILEKVLQVEKETEQSRRTA
jgi:hypothetical protein